MIVAWRTPGIRIGALRQTASTRTGARDTGVVSNDHIDVDGLTFSLADNFIFSCRFLAFVNGIAWNVLDLAIIGTLCNRPTNKSST